jgi:hypothetical protein
MRTKREGRPARQTLAVDIEVDERKTSVAVDVEVNEK